MERTPTNSQHTKLTLEKKILPPLLPGFELATFRSQVRRSNQQAIAASWLRAINTFEEKEVLFRSSNLSSQPPPGAAILARSLPTKSIQKLTRTRGVGPAFWGRMHERQIKLKPNRPSSRFAKRWISLALASHARLVKLLPNS